MSSVETYVYVFFSINIYVLACRSITQNVNAALDERQLWLLDCCGNDGGRFAPRYTRGENLIDFYRKNSNRYAVAMFSCQTLEQTRNMGFPAYASRTFTIPRTDAENRAKATFYFALGPTSAEFFSHIHPRRGNFQPHHCGAAIVFLWKCVCD